jgi:hypothetical protein
MRCARWGHRRQRLRETREQFSIPGGSSLMDRGVCDAALLEAEYPGRAVTRAMPPTGRSNRSHDQRFAALNLATRCLRLSATGPGCVRTPTLFCRVEFSSRPRG